MLPDAYLLEIVSTVWKIIATAGFVIIVGRLAWSAGPLLTSIIVALPVNIGPGLFLISLTEDSAFIVESALHGLAGGAAVSIFIVSFVRAASFTKFYIALSVGLICWGLASWFILDVNLTTKKALILVAIGIISAYIFLPRSSRKTERVAAPASWNFLFKRGVLAGVIITSIVLGAPFLGAGMAGILLSFPTTLCITGWMLQAYYGIEFVAVTYRAASRALILYFAFCLGVIFLAPIISGPLAIILSFILVASLGAVFGYIMIRLGRSVYG